MEKQIEEIIDSCYDEETTIDESGNIEGGKLTLNKEKLAKAISELFKGMYQQSKGLTDEKIEKKAYNYCAYQGQPDGEPEFDEKSYNDFIKGAEYARDQMQGNLREELVKLRQS